MNPAYLLPEILLGTIATVAFALIGLGRGVRRADLPPRDRRRVFWTISTLLLAWLFSALALSRSGFFQASAANVPTIPLGLLIPIAAGVILFRRWQLFRRVIDGIPQSWIVIIQVYRVEGLVFLTLLAKGLLPGAFAWPAGIGDIIVGLLAPVAGIAYMRSARGSAGLLWAWNLLGMADLIVAVTTGFPTSPSQLQLLSLDRPNQLISAFPLVLIPVFLVPLSVLLHLASLEKLRPHKMITASPVHTARATSAPAPARGRL